jgi:GTPase SAR1 family protein
VQQNCLEASLEVLEKTIQNMKEHNENRSLIVLCNKTDLFTERLKNVAFSSEFSDYQGRQRCRYESESVQELIQFSRLEQRR